LKTPGDRDLEIGQVIGVAIAWLDDVFDQQGGGGAVQASAKA
jgi:hypothetical protein